MTTFFSNRAIYETVIRDAVPQTRVRLKVCRRKVINEVVIFRKILGFAKSICHFS